jgi:hypothetical protein
MIKVGQQDSASRDSLDSMDRDGVFVELSAALPYRTKKPLVQSMSSSDR